MPFIGNTPDVNFTSFAKQDLTGVTGSPAKRGFTLSHAVANANEIEVFVNNVRQEPTESYTVNGTGLTMTGDVETTDDFYIIYLGKAIQTTVPPDGSVGTAKIADSAVTASKVDSTLHLSTIKESTGTNTALNITSGGIINMPLQPSIQFQGNNANNVNIGNTHRFGASDDGHSAFDITNGDDSHSRSGITYTASNGRFTVSTAGIYLVYFTAYSNDPSSANNRITIRKNGTSQYLSHYHAMTYGSMICSSLSNCSANDYFDFQHTTGVTRLFYLGSQHTGGYIIKLA